MSRMEGKTLYSIGELARRTGLTVKAIRFYADRGIVPPSRRDQAGRRRYDTDALARLRLLRTLRELGLTLSMIRKVLDGEVELADVLKGHADAVAVQIRVLRLRHAVLTVALQRGCTPKEIEHMHRHASLSAQEQRRLIGQFIDSAFGPLTADPASAGIVRSMTPDLPVDPAPEQVDAWVTLIELSQDLGFRAALRRLAEHYTADRGPGDTIVRRDAVALVQAEVEPALAAGIDPVSPQAEPVVAAVTTRYATDCRMPADVAVQRRLLTRLEAAADPRRETYLRLLYLLNGWPPPVPLGPILAWSINALRARTGRAA